MSKKALHHLIQTTQKRFLLYGIIRFVEQLRAKPYSFSFFPSFFFSPLLFLAAYQINFYYHPFLPFTTYISLSNCTHKFSLTMCATFSTSRMSIFLEGEESLVFLNTVRSVDYFTIVLGKIAPSSVEIRIAIQNLQFSRKLIYRLHTYYTLNIGSVG